MATKHRRRRGVDELQDFGTPEIHARYTVTIEGTRRARFAGAPEPHARVVDQRPLDRYWIRELLSPEQDQDGVPRRMRSRIEGRLPPQQDGDNGQLYLVGDRLRKDWDMAGLQPRMTANLFTTGGMGPAEIRLSVAKANQRKSEALNSMPTILRLCLIDVVCQDVSASAWALARHWAEKSGIVALRLALISLQEHYRLS